MFSARGVESLGAAELAAQLLIQPAPSVSAGGRPAVPSQRTPRGCSASRAALARHARLEALPPLPHDEVEALAHLREVRRRSERPVPRHDDAAIDLLDALSDAHPRIGEAVPSVGDVLVEREVAREQHALRRHEDRHVAARMRSAIEAQLDGPCAEVERQRVAERDVRRRPGKVAPILVDRRVEVAQELAVRLPLGEEVIAARIVRNDRRLEA